MSAATAIAHPNIALIKYWGKRDEALVLPVAGSLSMTLDAFPTTTTVTIDGARAADALVLNGARVTGEPLARVAGFLELVRERAGDPRAALVTTDNTAPTGAGLASSAAGFAALARAAATAYGLQLDARQLSRLARRGSGSAARSIVSGYAVWHAGDDAASFAEPVDALELRLVILLLDGREKRVSSREAMRRAANHRRAFTDWIATSERHLDDMLDACRDRDFTRMGELTESHATRMHALIRETTPEAGYLSATSVAVCDAVKQLREQGLEGYATADAGPNVAVLVRPEDAEAMATALSHFAPAQVVAPGPGAALVPSPVRSGVAA
ncbi:diphosphomevalonate decarboxylase [Leucobacter luti]|uniref:diphosphomevalonate decarboxylase n=1 Tax=Leucobacter luti TaxID=340320 RepID=UPI003CFDCF89